MENQAENLISVKGNQQLVMLSKENWLKECSPLSISRKCKEIKSFLQVFQSDFPSLAVINREYGPDFTEAYIGIWITNMVDYVSLGKKMGESQIEETAMLILDEYYMLTLADINLVFQRAKKGHYGELYDRLDGAIILSWFRKYFDERCEVAESISMREHESHRRSTNGQRTSGQMKKLIQESVHQYKLEKMKGNQ
jgi:hypothetical protein